MRRRPALAACVALCCSGLVAADTTQLRRLYDSYRLFDLRRALEQPGEKAPETLFYRAVAASCFGHDAEGIELFKQLLSEHPDQEIARLANQEMASAFERLGRYREAAEAYDQALKLTPARDPHLAENENTRDLMASLAYVPPQTAEFGASVAVQATRNSLGSWNVPVEINGSKGDWIFDTGANLSTISESEAKRMGLTVRQSKAWVGGSTGERNKLQLAVAKDLRFGSAHVHNVVLLVVADESLHVAPMHVQIAGILGLPVLRALHRVGIAQSGAVSIQSPVGSAGAPNLFLDAATPIVEVEHNGRRLQMFLDTGANASVLNPSFREALDVDELSHIQTKREKTGGVGKIVSRKVVMVPRLRIEVLGRPVELKNISLLPHAQGGDSHRDGVLAMDALWGGFVLDFDAMRMEVE